MSIQHASSFRDLKEILAADADVGDYSDVSYEIKERAHKLCSKFLGGAWKTVPIDSLNLTRMKWAFELSFGNAHIVSHLA